MEKIFLLIIFGIALSPSYSGANTINSARVNDCDMNNANKVFQLMGKRASYMESVAAYKFFEKGNVYDSVQEISVLNNTQILANTYGLNRQSLLNFTQIQMDLSKQIEQYWIKYWQLNPSRQPDKKSIIPLAQLRQQIKVIDNQLYPAIKLAEPSFNLCNQATLQQSFKSAFESVEGIPGPSAKNPTSVNFLDVMFNGVINVKLSISDF